MKAFIESPRFNTNIRYGTAGGMEFSTDITTVTSGVEHRLANWEEDKGHWTIGGADPLNQVEFEDLNSQFRVCRGQHVGFRFKDWADWYATPNQGVMLTVPSNPTLLQLAKGYAPGFGGDLYFRPIRKPVPGTIRIWKNGELVVDPMIEYSTGLFVAGEIAEGDSYQWSGEFDVPARFGTDTLEVTFQARDSGNDESFFTIQSLSIVAILQKPTMDASGKVIAPLAEVVSTEGYIPPPMPEVPDAEPITAHYVAPTPAPTPAPSPGPTPAPTPAPTPDPVPMPTPAPTTPPGGSRSALLQPFASDSIWNMPIGSDAVYVAAGIDPNPELNQYAYMPGADLEHIVLTPTAPLTDIRHSSVGWSGGDRCITSDAVMVRVPMPSTYLIPNSNRNEGGAFLLADGRTIVQAQPVARCTSGTYATAMVLAANVDLYGPGITGMHGGSGLSSIGGSIRMGELRPGQQGPKHALKVNVYAKQALFKATTRAQGFRWPAIQSDSYAVGWYGTSPTNTNSAMKMGSLLAIPASVDITAMGLITEPAKQLAWTLQNYGAYIVDDTYAPGFDFSIEDGPGGSKAAEFLSDFGFQFAQRVGLSGSRSDWVKDIQILVAALYVVDNNSSSSIGGGGTPLQPLAPAIAP